MKQIGFHLDFQTHVCEESGGAKAGEISEMTIGLYLSEGNAPNAVCYGGGAQGTQTAETSNLYFILLKASHNS